MMTQRRFVRIRYAELSQEERRKRGSIIGSTAEGEEEREGNLIERVVQRQVSERTI